jgi:hypothetical protein
MIKKIADNKDPNSLSSYFRRKRHQLFLNIIKNNGIKTILDIGGTQSYWKQYSDLLDNQKIILFNLTRENFDLPNFDSVVGDATNLEQFGDNQFEFVFSNSVIEHLFTWENQILMANEIRRVGKGYFVQTPNKYFPLEPHFLVPFFQFLPSNLKLFLLRNFKLGHVGKISDLNVAQSQIDEIRLLSKTDMKKLFPEATIYSEKFLFFTKSFVAFYTK